MSRMSKSLTLQGIRTRHQLEYDNSLISATHNKIRAVKLKLLSKLRYCWYLVKFYVVKSGLWLKEELNSPTLNKHHNNKVELSYLFSGTLIKNRRCDLECLECQDLI